MVEVIGRRFSQKKLIVVLSYLKRAYKTQKKMFSLNTALCKYLGDKKFFYPYVEKPLSSDQGDFLLLLSYSCSNAVGASENGRVRQSCVVQHQYTLYVQVPNPCFAYILSDTCSVGRSKDLRVEFNSCWSVASRFLPSSINLKKMRTWREFADSSPATHDRFTSWSGLVSSVPQHESTLSSVW